MRKTPPAKNPLDAMFTADDRLAMEYLKLDPDNPDSRRLWIRKVSDGLAQGLADDARKHFGLPPR